MRSPLMRAVVGLLFVGRWASAGDLDPPAGPVTPTHKTLTEVEPRIAVNAANTPGDDLSLFVISEPGSYYLVRPLKGAPGKHGIAIDAHPVTLDLNGFAVPGTTAALNGITVRGDHPGLVIRRGDVGGWPGIAVDVSGSIGSVVEDVRVRDSGTGILGSYATIVRRCSAAGNLAGGIFVGPSCLVVDSLARMNSGNGFYALDGSQIVRCNAEFNGDDGFYLDGDSCRLERCVALSNGRHGITSIYSAAIEDSVSERNGQHGIWSPWPCSVARCAAAQNDLDGISLADEAFLTACAVRANGRDGLRIGARGLVSGCQATGHSGGAGLRVLGSGNRIESNHFAGNQRGLGIEGAGNLVIRNSASGNETNYDIAGGNVAGPIVDAASIATDGSPHANYEH